MKKNKTAFLGIFGICLSLSAMAQSENEFQLITNPGGATIGYSAVSGVSILKEDGLLFKDLNKNGKLDKYEDWRLTAQERAENLATLMSVEQIAGLMLYSSHQSIPARAGGYFAGTYEGKPFEEGVTNPSMMTDQQKKFLKEDNLRHVLLTNVQTPEIAAQWNNRMQAFCESVGMGIPANNSTDPRHGTSPRAEYDAAAGGAISMWPSSLGLAATFDAELVRRFGQVAAEEYRALGITTALSPQVDIATEPRWARFTGTFGESPALSTVMAEAYCDGFQTTAGSITGWGKGSVNAMVKHWPGGGSGEAGRDAHYGAGKYAVYPGNNFSDHLRPFTEGAFKLKGKTQMASAVMPYYTISYNIDQKNHENVGNGYNKYLITDLLRNTYGYDGVVCTDWMVTGDHRALDQFIDGKSWGVENLSVAERHYKVLKAGVDQFGGNNDIVPVLDAYKMGVAEMGEAAMRVRMEQSAVRLLKNIFRVGLFENPYLNIAETVATVGKPEFMKEGYEAQLKSIVLLKNEQKLLPLASKTKLYIPKRFVAGSVNFLGIPSPATTEYPINMDLVKKYFEVTDNPEEADVALVCIENPNSGIGYSKADKDNGGNGYLPISLQYSEYTAAAAREKSMAGGDPMEDSKDRGYKGKSVKTNNATDAQLVMDTKAAMRGKPVIVSIAVNNPMVMSEIEPSANGILVYFGVQDQAILDIISGKAEPKGRLPMQMPASMEVVETQKEDVPFDMKPHKDTAGNNYDFGFGLNFKGPIVDGLNVQYKQ